MRNCPKCSRPSTGDRKICRSCGGILEQIADTEVVGEHSLPEASDASEIGAAARKSRPALGLPSGSVRALLTLLIVAVVIVQVVRKQAVDMLWTETLMIALAHYFTSRRLMQLPPEVIGRLTEEGYVQPEMRPLYLPRNSIRAVLILAFAGLALYLFQEGRLGEHDSLSILGVVAAYFLGMVLRFKDVPGWEDIKAAVILLALGITAGAYFLDQADFLPSLARSLTLALVLFYFGSR